MSRSKAQILTCRCNWRSCKAEVEAKKKNLIFTNQIRKCIFFLILFSMSLFSTPCFVITMNNDIHVEGGTSDKFG